MHIASMLKGCSVAIVHGDRFRGQYLASVLRSAGAVIAGPVADAADGLDLLDGTTVDAIVLGMAALDGRGRALVEEARGRGIPVLAVPSARVEPALVRDDVTALVSSHAGFQVAEALAALLGGATPQRGSSDPPPPALAPLELWGGLECTVNRVDDTYRDQVALSGHDRRLDDLGLFADLGLRAIRYPVLWERTAPNRDQPPDWTWPDERLHRLRELGMRPIVGLVHHGSGPRHTHLLDPAFPALLGHYAGQVAARYPWVDEWTPINEPLTTARFSAMYGHWYPHRRDERSFWLALLNQVDATRAAMRAIRRVNPAARLIQTDDLGRTYATAPLQYQADFDNLRRWAGWDMLFGRLDRHHPLFGRLARLGLADRASAIADDPCPPDVLGVNHYLTSDRFLDHRIERYPAALHGGNGRIVYADTEAVRVLDPPAGGFGTAMRDAWDRYATPLAITEVHNGSTRDEQLRWAASAWDTAAEARAAGIDVRAVTAWSLLGSHGWNTLLTHDGAYEAGVFDVTNGTPRPTALAALWRQLACGEERHPAAGQPGWWQRPERLLYPAHPSNGRVRDVNPPGGAAGLVICGADAAQRRVVAQACAVRGLSHRIGSVEVAPAEGTPWAIVDVAGAATPDGPPGYRVTITARERLAPVRATMVRLGDPSTPPRSIDAALDLVIDGGAGEWLLRDGSSMG